MYSWNARLARAASSDALFDGVAVVGVECLPRVPVVDRLVVVPLGDHRHFGVEPAHVLVHEVVAEVASELGEGLGHLGLFGNDDVVPGAAVRQLPGLRNGVVRVDRVAAVDEEVGLVAAHRLVAAHPAELEVDAPTLSRGVAGPREAHVLLAGRRGAERTGGGFRGTLAGREVLEHDAVEDALAAGQAVEPHARREVARFERRGPPHAAGVGERLAGREFDEHAGRTLRSAPHDCARAGNLAGLHAARDPRQLLRGGGGGERSRGESGGDAGGSERGGSLRGAGEECAAAEPRGTAE